MTNIWFTSDFHFGHTNIIEYCERPFTNCKEMNAVMIKLYNQLVKPDDIVYILGDLASWYELNEGQVAKIMRKLNGEKHLILGNHDKLNAFKYVEMGFISVHTYLYLPYADLHLTHDPAIAQGSKMRWVCGHVHNVFKRVGNVFNVGVDVHDFNPVNLKEIEAYFDAGK